MPDVSHGRKVFRCSQTRVLIALGIHSLEGISIGISYRGDLLSGLAIALIIRSLDPSLCTQLFDSDRSHFLLSNSVLTDDLDC